MGTTVPLQTKADLSATDGINSEHKQEQRQSSKDARPARRCGQPTSWRRVRDCAGQHGRGGGAPRHQPTLAERIRKTHQANATPPRRHGRPEKAKILLPEKSNTSTLVEKQIEKEKLATPGSMILTNPPGEDRNEERQGRSNKGDLPNLISKRQRSGRGSKGSGTSSKKSAK